MLRKPSRASRKALRRQQRRIRVRQFERQKLLNKTAAPGNFQFCLVLDNLKPDFNIGKIFRTADALGAREIHLIGTTFFNPATAMGSFKWVPAHFHSDFASCHAQLTGQGYQLFVLEPDRGPLLIGQKLPFKSAFILGHEEFGISFAPEAYSDLLPVRIPQYGKVQSLNVSIAAALVSYEYIRQHHQGVATAAPRPQR